MRRNFLTYYSMLIGTLFLFSFAYADITDVSVTSGTKYVVATAMNGTGAARVRLTDQLPNTYGNITINYSCYKSGYDSDTYPTSWSHETRTKWNWGLSDITFVPDE